MKTINKHGLKMRGLKDMTMQAIADAIARAVEGVA